MENTIPAESSSELDQTKAVPQRTALTGTILVGATAIVVATDFLTWSYSIGLGFAICSVVIGLVLMFNRKEHWKYPATWVWFSALVLVSVLNAFQADAIGVMLGCLLILFGAGQMAFPKLVPFWVRLIEGLISLLRFPIELPNISWQVKNRNVPIVSLSLYLTKIFRIVLPAVLLCIPFVILLLSGNAVIRSILGDLLIQIFNSFNDWRPPTVGRTIFWAALAMASLGALIKVKPATAIFLRTHSFSLPKDESLVIWQNRFALLMVNVLFLVVNWADLSFLWGDKKLPAGVNYSQFVHEGTWSLLTCALLAATVLSVIFFQHKDICRAKGIRLLGYLWIVQNLVLVAGVVFRVLQYVDYWQLSLLRVYLFGTLALVAVGFVLLAIRIQWQKSFSWLVSANVIALFIMLLGLHAWDEHRFVAEYNCAAIENASEDSKKVLDVKYLETLGPSAWPTLMEVGHNPDVFGKKVTREAQTVVESIRKKVGKQNKDWRSLQFRSQRAIQLITAVEEDGWQWEPQNPYLKK